MQVGKVREWPSTFLNGPSIDFCGPQDWRSLQSQSLYEKIDLDLNQPALNGAYLHYFADIQITDRQNVEIQIVHIKNNLS
jgi:hypothetical protein